MSNECEIPGELEDTDSYDLAQVESEEKESGAIQPVQSSIKAPDLQWKPSSRTVEEPLASGLSNEDLWLLIRRFNKVCLTDDTEERCLHIATSKSIM